LEDSSRLIISLSILSIFSFFFSLAFFFVFLFVLKADLAVIYHPLHGVLGKEEGGGKLLICLDSSGKFYKLNRIFDLSITGI
jgi:hypothetical protein